MEGDGGRRVSPASRMHYWKPRICREQKVGLTAKKLFANGHDEGSRQNSYFAVAILVLDGKILFAEKEFHQQTILPLVFFCRRRQNTFFPSQHEFIAK